MKYSPTPYLSGGRCEPRKRIQGRKVCTDGETLEAMVATGRRDEDQGDGSM